MNETEELAADHTTAAHCIREVSAPPPSLHAAGSAVRVLGCEKRAVYGRGQIVI